MNSQEELARCLRQLTEALGSDHAPRLSIVRDGNASRIAAARDGHGQDVVTTAKPAAVK
jgi:hypothetical protein